MSFASQSEFNSNIVKKVKFNICLNRSQECIVSDQNFNDEAPTILNSETHSCEPCENKEIPPYEQRPGVCRQLFSGTSVRRLNDNLEESTFLEKSNELNQAFLEVIDEEMDDDYETSPLVDELNQGFLQVSVNDAEIEFNDDHETSPMVSEEEEAKMNDEENIFEIDKKLLQKINNPKMKRKSEQKTNIKKLNNSDLTKVILKPKRTILKKARKTLVKEKQPTLNIIEKLRKTDPNKQKVLFSINKENVKLVTMPKNKVLINGKLLTKSKEKLMTKQDLEISLRNFYEKVNNVK